MTTPTLCVEAHGSRETRETQETQRLPSRPCMTMWGLRVRSYTIFFFLGSVLWLFWAVYLLFFLSVFYGAEWELIP